MGVGGGGGSSSRHFVSKMTTLDQALPPQAQIPGMALSAMCLVRSLHQPCKQQSAEQRPVKQAWEVSRGGSINGWHSFKADVGEGWGGRVNMGRGRVGQGKWSKA